MTSKARPTESASRLSSSGSGRSRPADHRLGQPGPGQALAAGLPGAEQVDADPPDHRGQPAVHVVDRRAVGAGAAQPGLLQRVLGLGDASPASGRRPRAAAAGAPRTVRRTTACRPRRPASFGGPCDPASRRAVIRPVVLHCGTCAPSRGTGAEPAAEELEHSPLHVVGGAVEHPREVQRTSLDAPVLVTDLLAERVPPGRADAPLHERQRRVLLVAHVGGQPVRQALELGHQSVGVPNGKRRVDPFEPRVERAVLGLHRVEQRTSCSSSTAARSRGHKAVSSAV